MKIRYMDTYKEGEKQFSERTYINLDNLDDNLEDLAWNAYYNDKYKIKSDAEGYFVITEYYGIDEGNKWMLEQMTSNEVGAA